MTIGELKQKYEGYEPTRKLWFAVQRDSEDDWGEGSFDVAEAISMAEAHKYPMLVIIDANYDEDGVATTDGECIEEIQIEYPESRVKTWRTRAMLSQQGLSNVLGIPKRTIENWETGTRQCPKWTEDLVVNELKRLTVAIYKERARKVAGTLLPDENGRRPVFSWAVVDVHRVDEFIHLFKTMQEALEYATEEAKEKQPQRIGICVGYIACNETDSGKLEPWYTDREGNVYADYDGFQV